jgi:hypothetical protein
MLMRLLGMNRTFDAPPASDGTGVRRKITLGVAAEPIGAGGWSASGTSLIDGGASQTWPTDNVAGGYARVSNFQYSKYYGNCAGYSTQVTDWEGGDITESVSIGSAAKCELEIGPTMLTLSKGTAWTFSAGVNIKSAIGINLSARTGHSTSLEETFKLTDTAHTRYGCGRDGDPNSQSPAPGYVVAGASSSGGS